MNINGQMHLIKQETFLRQQGTKNCRSQDFFNLYATPSHQHITKSLFSQSLLHGGLLLCTTSKLSSGVHLISINVHLESPICPCFCTYLSTGTIICHSLNCKSKTCPTLAWLWQNLAAGMVGTRTPNSIRIHFRKERKKKIPEIYTLSRSQLQVFHSASQAQQSQKIHRVPGAHVSVSGWFPSNPKNHSTVGTLQRCSQSHRPAGAFPGTGSTEGCKHSAPRSHGCEPCRIGIQSDKSTLQTRNCYSTKSCSATTSLVFFLLVYCLFTGKDEKMKLERQNQVVMKQLLDNTDS